MKARLLAFAWAVVCALGCPPKDSKAVAEPTPIAVLPSANTQSGTTEDSERTAEGSGGSGGGSSQTIADAGPTDAGSAEPNAGLAACCAALRQSAAAAPLAERGVYLAAAGTCDSLARSSGADGLRAFRAILAHLGPGPAGASGGAARLPVPCR